MTAHAGLTDFVVARYCQTKAIKLTTKPKWEDSEEALRQATPNNMHQFLNWYLKLQYNCSGHCLKGIKKASSLKGDWKYFWGYYQKVIKHDMNKEMAEAVHTVGSLDANGVACHLYKHLN